MRLMSKEMKIWLCLTLVLCISSLAQALEWQDVAGDLMSPACPGRTLLNCTSSQAEQWRELIRQKLARGESKDQIIQHFVEIEGESILAAPPKKGFALTVWLFPAFIILNGAVMILLLTRRWTYRTTHSSQSDHPPTTAPNPDAITDQSSEKDFTRYKERLRKELDEFNS
jgi:cytochrome c-type biogenesis protein CcmH/NrfF